MIRVSITTKHGTMSLEVLNGRLTTEKLQVIGPNNNHVTLHNDEFTSLEFYEVAKPESEADPEPLVEKNKKLNKKKK